MKVSRIALSLGIIAAAVVGAGLFWWVWVVLSLLTRDIRGPVSEAAWWLGAPPVMAAGFTAGVWLAGRASGRTQEQMGCLYLWLVAACSVGAAAIFAFGPMLIVFGMFALGTVIVAAREILVSRRR